MYIIANRWYISAKAHFTSVCSNEILHDLCFEIVWNVKCKRSVGILWKIVQPFKNSVFFPEVNNIWLDPKGGFKSEDTGRFLLLQ